MFQINSQLTQSLAKMFCKFKLYDFQLKHCVEIYCLHSCLVAPSESMLFVSIIAISFSVWILKSKLNNFIKTIYIDYYHYIIYFSKYSTKKISMQFEFVETKKHVFCFSVLFMKMRSYERDEMPMKIWHLFIFKFIVAQKSVYCYYMNFFLSIVTFLFNYLWLTSIFTKEKQ